jgi:hypothetical protein
MKNRLITATLLVSMISVSLLAGGNASQETSARLDGLGLNSFQTRDNYNIWANPAYMNSYRSEATINISGQDITKVMAGGNVGTSVGAFGVYFGRQSRDNTAAMVDPVDGVQYNTVGGTFSTLVPINQFDLFYAAGLSENIDLGLRFSRKGKDESNTTTSGSITKGSDHYTSEYELESGLVFKSIGLDVSLAIGLPNYYQKETLSNTNTQRAESDGAFFVTLQGGYDIDFEGDSKLRINGFVGSASLDSKASDDLDTETRTASLLEISAGVTYENQLSEQLRLFLSTSLVYESISSELQNQLNQTGKDDRSRLLLPVVAALEVNVGQSWQVRAGASVENLALYNNIKTENISGTGNDTSAEYSPTQEMDVNLNFGLGYHPIKTVSIDLALRQGQLFGGSNLFDNLTSKITGSYRF